uniref:Uncharacterized protein n=1 Tax=Ananas comosus var. bracteatus TaxID=296719 RepID=A0A6V7NPR1_ANACO|nr:unnamed protein product [Ananas comosus var. bracteatus]
MTTKFEIQKFHRTNSFALWLCRSLNDKVADYARVWITRLVRRVSHRLVILGCVCVIGLTRTFARERRGGARQGRCSIDSVTPETRYSVGDGDEKAIAVVDVFFDLGG